MLKKLTVVMLVVVFSTALYSNVTISGKHKNKLKDGNKISCSYCHSGVQKIEKKKGQLANKKLNGVPLFKIKGCNGSGCHM